MRYCGIALASIVGCTGIGDRGLNNFIDQDTFALASRYWYTSQLSTPGRVPAVELWQRGGRMQSHLPSRPAAASGWLDIRRTILPRTLIGSVHMDGTPRRRKTRLPAALEARHRTTPISQLIEVEQGLNLTYDLSPE